MHEINVGDRKSHVMSLDDDKKHASFSNTDNIRSYEGLKLVMHPSLRKGTTGFTAVSPCTHLVRGIAWEKLGVASTDCHKKHNTNSLWNKT